MNSPFPGMDPYLEQHWLDVHTTVITYARDALNALLPADLVARSEERLAVEIDDSPVRVIYPDVSVLPDDAGVFDGVSVAAAAAVAEPVVLETLGEPATEHRIVILDRSGNQVVTVIECLSPSNKREPGLATYLQKRQALFEAQTNIVEIDLVREGHWRAIVRPGIVPANLCTAYRVVTRRAGSPGRLEYFPISLRKRLPIIPIPLRPADKDVALDLQTLLDQVYRNGRYGSLDYSKECVPPLAGEDVDWADRLLKNAGRRQAAT